MTKKTFCFIAGLLLCTKLAAEEPLTLKGSHTYGPFGPPHASRFIVGDVIFTKHTISGLRHDSEGNVDFSYKADLYSKDGKLVTAGEWSRATKKESTSVIHFPAGRQTSKRPVGEYIEKCIVKDNTAGRTTECNLPFELVVPKGVSILQMRCSSDARGFICGSTLVVGDGASVNCELANFKSDGVRMHCQVKLTIHDLQGKPVDWALTSSDIDREISKYGDDNSEEFSYEFVGFKSGKYVIRLEVKDLVDGKQATELLPLHVLESPDWTLPKEVRAAERKSDSLKR